MFASPPPGVNLATLNGYTDIGRLPNVGRGLKNVYNKVTLLNAGQLARVRAVTYGDSYAQKIFACLMVDPNSGLAGFLPRQLGGIAGAYGRSANNNSYVSPGTPTGTVTTNFNDFDVSPDGITYTVTSGNTASWVLTAKAFDSGKLYLVNETIGGTCKIQVDGVDVSGYTSINLSGTIGTLTVVTLTGLNVSVGHTLSVIGLSGSCRILTVGFENTTISGIVPINISQGGIALNSPTTAAWSNWTALLADLQPDLMTYEAKEASSYFGTSLPVFFMASQLGSPRMDAICVGSPPVSPDPTSDQAAQNDQLKKACATYGYIYWDSYRLFQAGTTPNSIADYALLDSIGKATFSCTTTNGSPTLSLIVTSDKQYPLVGATLVGLNIPTGSTVLSINPSTSTLVMTANATTSATNVSVAAGGWGGGGVHVLAAADQYRTNALIHDLFVPTEYGRPLAFDVASQTTSVSKTLAIGITPNAPVLEIDSDTSFDLDTYVYFKRQIRWRLAGNATDLFSFDARNNSGNPSSLPLYLQIGVGNAGLVGGDANTLYVRRTSSGNLNNNGDLRARTIGLDIVTANISGTYQVPVLTGTTFRLTPTVNGTIISAVNGSALVDGQIIYIQIIRGGTTYTYSFDSHFQFAGGIAPTIGMITNTSDFYVFQYYGNWKSISMPTIAVP